ncbi:MAG: CaiB/BaiF CoA-transferase family protein [Anaerolineales bacterium]|nr:CaiB/BaiF CoA-transferase family protein [Anaerolineales bacterium]
MSTEEGLLKGVRVIDLTRILAGPYCTMMLGDLGADIIKIEAPGHGDDTRHWGPPFTESGEAAYFLCVNRNKRSLTLNLKSEGGLKILKDLISQGDVLVENFKAGTLSRWGLDYETLQQISPGLIYCTVTGYGYTGPYSARPGYDFIVQAMGGFMSITGPEEGDPHRAGVAIADISAGMFAASAVLAALYARERTGQGQRIDMALLDSQIALLTYAASNYFVSGEIPARHGNAHPNIVPYQSFRARDRQFAFAAGNDGQWEKFCHAVERPQWVKDQRFSTNAARIQNRDLLVVKLNELFGTRNAADWLTLCEQIGLPSGPINTIDKVFDNEQVKARAMRVTAQHSKDGVMSLLNSPLRIPTSPVSIRRAPPTLGGQTEEILDELLGLDKDRVSELRQQGVL